MKTDLRKIEKIIHDKLAPEFKFFKITHVLVKEDWDQDEDRILCVDVVFDGDIKNVDAKALASSVRMVRPALYEIGEEAFPVISFVAVSEAGQLIRDGARYH